MLSYMIGVLAYIVVSRELHGGECSVKYVIARLHGEVLGNMVGYWVTW